MAQRTLDGAFQSSAGETPTGGGVRANDPLIRSIQGRMALIFRRKALKRTMNTSSGRSLVTIEPKLPIKACRGAASIVFVVNSVVTISHSGTLLLGISYI